MARDRLYSDNKAINNEIWGINENGWKLYTLDIKQLHEVKIRDFQYQIINKSLVINSFLAKINKIDSEVCKEQPE